MQRTFDEALDDLVDDFLEDESREGIIAALAAKLEEMMDAVKEGQIEQDPL